MITDKFESAKQPGTTLADATAIQLRAEVQFLRPDEIIPDPDQPWQSFDKADLARLAASLRKYDQLQPVLVRKEQGKYVLVAGERRWRAAIIAKMPRVQALVCRGGDVRSIQLVENLLREDLKPVERARAYYAILKREGWKVRELARHLSLEHSGVAKTLALLGLDEEIQALIDAEKIPPTTAYEISKKPKAEHAKLARAAAEGRLKGDDLRKPKPAPAPVAAPAPARGPAPAPVAAPPPPAPAPVLTLGGGPGDDAWTYESGRDRMTVTGPRDHAALLAFLEKALKFARSKKRLAGGVVGRR